MYMPYLATDLPASGARPPVEADRPLVLTRSKGSAEFVAHACPRALAAGVYPGMPVAQARAILRQVLVLPHEPRRDASTLERLARWAQRFSPVVEGVSPDVLLLDVSGCARLFRGEENIVRQARAGLAVRHIHTRAAIADTVGAAWALAHAAEEPAVVAPPGQASPYWVGLPPTALRLDEKTVATLDTLGIRSIGDLLMLPRASLSSRFGAEPVLRLRQLLGDVPEPISPPRRAPVFSAQMPFGPTDRLEVVLAALQHVVAALCEQLVAGGVAARGVLCVVYFAECEPASAWVGLSRPSREAGHLHALLAPHIERIAPSAGASGLRLTATETARWRAVQEDLFVRTERPDEEAVGALIDRLANRLGHQTVVRTEAVEDHQPDKSFRYVPLVGRDEGEKKPSPERKRGETGDEGIRERSREREKADGRSDRTRDPCGVETGERPLRLFLRPLPVRVIALGPEGPPTWFHYRRREHVVSQAAGPERLETGWWRGADIRRDYFRVTTKSGQQFWLFRDLKTRQWFVHGSYE